MKVSINFKEEAEEEIMAVKNENIDLAAKKLNLEKPSQDEVSIPASRASGMSITEFRDALRTIINLRSTTGH